MMTIIDIARKLHLVDEKSNEPIPQDETIFDNEMGYDAYGTEDFDETIIEEEPYNMQNEYVQPVVTSVATPAPSATVVMLTPYDIKTSQVVADYIREGNIVICNLTPNANNQRVVDYISGAVYALDGKIEPTPVKTTFVCTPKNVKLIVNDSTQSDATTKVSAL